MKHESLFIGFRRLSFCLVVEGVEPVVQQLPGQRVSVEDHNVDALKYSL